MNLSFYYSNRLEFCSDFNYRLSDFFFFFHIIQFRLLKLFTISINAFFIICTLQN